MLHAASYTVYCIIVYVFVAFDPVHLMLVRASVFTFTSTPHSNRALSNQRLCLHLATYIYTVTLQGLESIFCLRIAGQRLSCK